MSSDNVLLSLIVPVYNVELYLGECLDSILEQVTDECEIVLVDDGSSDSSGQICQRYAEKNSLITLIKKENGGLSSARNAGISVANGKYITFIDSDDLIFPNSIPQILDWIRLEGADMCFLRAFKLYPTGNLVDLGENIIRSHIKATRKEDSVAHLASRPKYPGSAWAKLYRRAYILDNNLHFPYDRRYSEDLGFILDCIVCAKSYDALDTPFYKYRQNRVGSITNKVTNKNFRDLLLFIEESEKKLTTNRKALDPISKSCMGFVAYEYSILLYLYNHIDDSNQQAAAQALKTHRWCLKYAGNIWLKTVYLLCCFLGIKATSFAMNLYRKAVAK